MSTALGLALALASAFALNWGWIAQHGAAHELPPLSLRHPLASLRSLFRDLAWLSGFVVGIVLIAEVGGFGSLFNVFVVHEFRAYNRVVLTYTPTTGGDGVPSGVAPH